MRHSTLIKVIPPFLCVLSATTAQAQTPTYQVIYQDSWAQDQESFSDINDSATYIGNYNVGFHGSMFGTIRNSPFPLHDSLYNFDDINNAGSIAGKQWGGEADNRTRAAVLIGGNVHVLADWNSQARAINNTGNVVGYGGRPGNGIWLWNAAANTYQTVSNDPGTSLVTRMRVNSNNTVAYDKDGRINYWSQPIGERTWFDTTNTRKYTLAGISDAGWIAANSDTKIGGAGNTQGLLRKPDGTVINFSTLLGVSRTELRAVSDSGLVLGLANALGFFVWSEPSGFTFIKLPPAPPGVFPNYNCFGINNLGQVGALLTTNFIAGGTTYNSVVLGPVPAPSGITLAIFGAGIGSTRTRRRTR